MSLWSELKRRNVFKVAVAYIVSFKLFSMSTRACRLSEFRSSFEFAIQSTLYKIDTQASSLRGCPG